MSTNNTLMYTEKQNGIAEITLNRPEIRNAFDSELIQKLISAFEQAELSPAVRVILLQANGKHFSAGADLNWMRGMAKASYKENYEDAQQLARMLSTINYISKPVITKVQGAAFGGAIGLIACSDIVIASDDAKFSLSEVKLGLCPATISPYVIDAIGARAARRLFITGEVFNADKALSLELISETAPTENVGDKVTDIINSILNNGPVALKKSKELIHHISSNTKNKTGIVDSAIDSPIDSPLIDYTCELIAELRVSEEGQEGLNAFLEKRTPNWIKVNHDK